MRHLEYKTRLKIGTAGWSIPARNRIEFPQTGSGLEKYAQRFNAVEINSSFYRPHKRSTYAKWSTQVPDDFSFSVKLPRRITHELRLREIAQPLREFEDQVAGLGSKLGSVLVQLPPSLKFSRDDAWSSFHALREAFKCAVICEPRHLSWFSKDVESLFTRLGIARAAVDPPLFQEASRTAGENHTRYYRLHGSPDIYYSNYGTAELQSYAQVMGQHMQDSEVWCIFDNTANGWATSNAISMQQLLAVKE